MQRVVRMGKARSPGIMRDPGLPATNLNIPLRQRVFPQAPRDVLGQRRRPFRLPLALVPGEAVWAALLEGGGVFAPGGVDVVDCVLDLAPSEEAVGGFAAEGGECFWGVE